MEASVRGAFHMIRSACVCPCCSVVGLGGLMGLGVSVVDEGGGDWSSLDAEASMRYTMLLSLRCLRSVSVHVFASLATCCSVLVRALVPDFGSGKCLEHLFELRRTSGARACLS